MADCLQAASLPWDDADTQHRRRSHEGLRYVVGSVTAVALLLACAYTTLRSTQEAERFPGARIEGDMELARDLQRDGLEAYGDSNGFGQLALASPAAVTQLPLGMNKPNNPCTGDQCAYGALGIDRITPNHCSQQGGCIVTFWGSNIVSGKDLAGAKADEKMSVELVKDGATVSACTEIKWFDNKNFECTVQPGEGSDLEWKVDIPDHAYKDKHGGTGGTFLGSDGFRRNGEPCKKNLCGYFFSYDAPASNKMISGGDDHPFSQLPLGMNKGKKRKGKHRKHGTSCDGPQCARGRLRIDDIRPTTCSTQGGCLITFKGQNIVYGDDLTGHLADEHIFVTLHKDGEEVTGCKNINWIDNTKFECTLEPGEGSDLMWNVSIPGHDYARKRKGTGWIWLGSYGFHDNGSPCEAGGLENTCGYYFTFDSPSVNTVEPAVLDTVEPAIMKLTGTNFGKDAQEVSVELNGQVCRETELADDNTIRCLTSPVMEPGVVPCTVSISGQQIEIRVPVNDIPDFKDWSFTSGNTFKTEQWNITVAAMMSQTGLGQDWFDAHQAIILVSDPVQSVAEIMARTGLTEWESAAVLQFRTYLKSHFDSDTRHEMTDDDGVYVSDLGNKLNGDEKHDQKVLEKQIQVLEAETGDSRTDLARVVGKDVKEDPPCAGYPSCTPADSVGHKGWVWHWEFDKKRESWAWKYGPISDGTEPPVSCAYCDPVKLHARHSKEEVKDREQKCLHCVQGKFKNIDSCECADFKAMCLQASGSELDGTMQPEEKHVESPAAADVYFAASSPLIDTVYAETRCSVRSAAENCTKIGGISSADGLACCPASCGQCGGSECYQKPGGGESCCQGAITQSGVECGSPPCLFKVDLEESDFRAKSCAAFGGILDPGSLQCCDATCGACGGEGCERAPGGADSCCTDNVAARNKMCSETVHAPCSLKAEGGPGTEREKERSTSTSVADQCRALGGIPDLFGNTCCPVSCNQCGGLECERREGGADSCCSDNIVEGNVQCGSPPCILAAVDAGKKSEEASECVAAGGIPDSSGFRCCPASCGTCGGLGCASRDGGMDCCVDVIDGHFDGVSFCGAPLGFGKFVEPPCITQSPREASERVAVTIAASETGTHGQDSSMISSSRMDACMQLGGVVDPLGVACCPASCGVCGGEGCFSREGGADACCGDNLASANVTCGSPPCMLSMEADLEAVHRRVDACEAAGGIADATGFRCCNASCGVCGGLNCQEREGGADNCCVDNLDFANVLCGLPPCLTEGKGQMQAQVVQGHADACAGMGGVSDPFGLSCCPGSCGSCGGEGCQDRDGGTAACCTDGIMANYIECGSPPCMWAVDTSALLARTSACEAAGGIPDPTGIRCCPATCGSCGGEGCMSREGGGASCCADNIDAANTPCGNPPCLMESIATHRTRAVSTAEQACNDIGGISDALGLTCCASSCGICGGTGCDSRPGGADSCCSDVVTSANQICGQPPCVREVEASASTARRDACSAIGGISDASGMFCCDSTCGACGGSGCESREGGAEGCCADNLSADNVPCGHPPCLMHTYAQAQSRDAQVFSEQCASRGGVPDASGLKCCAASCGACGGEGCALRPGGAELCCGDNIGAANVSCGEPACTFQSNPRSVKARSNACEDLGGLLEPNGLACCPASCGSCGGVDCASRPGGAQACCGDNIGEANEVCGHPPCLMFAVGSGENAKWWEFNGPTVGAAKDSDRRTERGTRHARRSRSEFSSFRKAMLSPFEMHDRRVRADADQVMAEWSPQEYVETSKYPASRLAGGIGAAGTSIRDPGVLLCWSLFLLFAISFIVYVLIYKRGWFIPRQPEVEDRELLLPGSPRSVGSV